MGFLCVWLPLPPHSVCVCLLKVLKFCRALVAHTCNPSYMGGWDWEVRVLKPAWANISWEPSISQIARAKWTGSVVQAVECLLCPEFKPENCQKKNLNFSLVCCSFILISEFGYLFIYQAWESLGFIAGIWSIYVFYLSLSLLSPPRNSIMFESLFHSILHVSHILHLCFCAIFSVTSQICSPYSFFDCVQSSFNFSHWHFTGICCVSHF
jgi:hypothetical protein